MFNIKNPEISLMQYSCDGRSFNRCCDCNPHCMRYKTCCIDKLWDKNNPILIETYLDRFVNETSKYKDLTCQKTLTLPSGHSSENILMVSTCLPKAAKGDVTKCLNDISGEFKVPVFGIDNYLYKNSFCAKCNFVNEFETVNITADCVSGPATAWFRPASLTTQPPTTKPPVNTNLLSRFRGCFFQIVRNNRVKFPYVSGCGEWSKLNKKCPKSSKFYKYCNAYTGKMVGYANYHCFKCNTETSPSKSPPITTCTGPSSGRRGSYTWSFTINFGSNTHIQIRNTFGRAGNENQVYCGTGEMLDVVKGTCIKFFCPPNYKVEGSRCLEIAQRSSPVVNIRNSAFDSCLLSQKAKLYVIPLNNNISVSKFVKAFQLEANTSSESFNRVPGIENTVLKRFIPVNVTFVENLQIILSNQSSTMWFFVKEFVVSQLQEQIVSKLYGFDISATFPYKRLCAQPIVYDGNRKTFTSNCSSSINNATIHRSEFISWMVLNKNSTNRKMATCSLFHLQSSCRLQLINSIYVIDANKTLTYKRTNNKSISLAAGQYFPLQNGFGVCAKQANSRNAFTVWRWLLTVQDIEYYISLTGTSISIVCYISIILTYMLFKELRNIPGLNVLGLCYCLLIADISFLIATQAHTVHYLCKAIAIILHWSLLTAQMWVIVISIEIAARFGALTVISKDRNMKRFVQYCIFAFALPTIIVSLATVLNETNTIYFGYGDNGVCWIKNLNSRIVTYIIPVALAFIVSGITISYTIYKIKTENNRSKQALSKSSRNKISVSKIALKLVVILGLTEIVGFIQITTNGVFTEEEQQFNSTFAMMYTILRSFRGLMMWFIYIFNSRIYNIYKRFIKKQKPARRRAETVEMTLTDTNTSSTPTADRKLNN